MSYVNAMLKDSIGDDFSTLRADAPMTGLATAALVVHATISPDAYLVAPPSSQAQHLLANGALVDAGLAQTINTNTHVLKISLPAWGRPKNHKHLSLRAARGFLDQPIDLHSF